MKVKLIFDTDIPEQRMELKRCMEATKMAIALFEIVNNSHIHVTSIDQYQQRINDAVEGINLDEIIE